MRDALSESIYHQPIAMNEFRNISNRDASAAIRGFVYQVDLTVLRWISLDKSNAFLELECGEDIDTVTKELGVLDDTAPQSRLMEQVKNVTKPISIRSAAVVEAILNGFHHSELNPLASLTVQFTTTAQLTRERPSPFPKGMNALSIWGDITHTAYRANQLPSDYLSSLRVLLQQFSKPKRYSQEIFSRFQNFVSNSPNQELFAFLKKFEWHPASSDISDVRCQITSALVSKGLADDSQASSLYKHLFVFVFSALASTNGEDRMLDHIKLQTEIQNWLNNPTLSSSQKQLADRILKLEQEAKDDIAELRQNLSQHSLQIEGLHARANFLAPMLDVPDLVECATQRTLTIDSLIPIKSERNWIALYGAYRSGKTQFALLLAQRFGVCFAWIRLRGLDEFQSSDRVDAAIQALAETNKQSTNAANREAFYRLGLKKYVNCVLVIDDMPQLSASNQFSDQLMLLAKVCTSLNIVLITTSNIRLSTTIGDAQAYQFSIPPLTDGEFEEMLGRCGANTNIYPKNAIPFLNALAKAKPFEARLIAEHLRRRNWEWSWDVYFELQKRQHTQDSDESALRQFIETVEDSQTRELAYRISVINKQVDLSDVIQLSNIDPAVDRPRERLTTLTGLWLQKQIDGKYESIPSLTAIAKTELQEQIRKECHSYFGKKIIQSCNGMLDQFEAVRAFTCFAEAENWEELGEVVLIMLSGLCQTDFNSPETDLFLAMWASTPTPQGMSLSARIAIRALQLRARYKRQLESNFVIRELIELSKIAGINEAASVLSASGSMILCDILPSQNLPVIQKIVTLFSKAKNDQGDLFLENADIHLASIIWIYGDQLETSDQFRQWLNLVQSLPDNLKTSLTGMPIATAFCKRTARRMWLKEINKSEQLRNWEVIRTWQTELADKAIECGLPVLAACSKIYLFLITAEHYNNPERAIAEAQALLSVASEPHELFLRMHEIGMNYVYRMMDDKAILWLQNAATQPHLLGFEDEQAITYLHIGRILHEQTHTGYLDNTLHAITILQNAYELNVVNLAKAYGENAIAHWIGGESGESFISLSKAVIALLSDSPEMRSEVWKTVYVRIGHALGYYYSKFLGKESPILPSGENYETPIPGHFLHQNDLSSYFELSRLATTPILLASFAREVNNTDQMFFWAQKAIEEAQNQKLMAPLALAISQAIPHFLYAGKIAEVIDLTFEASITYAAMRLLRNQQDAFPNELLTTNQFDPLEILGSSPTEGWQIANGIAVDLGIIPVILYFAEMWLKSPLTANDLAISTSDACTILSLRAVDKDFWGVLANTFKLILNQETSKSGFDEYLNAINLNDGGRLKFVIQLVGPSLIEGYDLYSALSGHLSLLLHLQAGITDSSSTYQLFAEPFVCSYWERKVRESAFLFRSPIIVKDEVSSAISKSPGQRAALVIRAIANSLQQVLPEQAKVWLLKAEQLNL